MSELIWEEDEIGVRVNITPTTPGYCQFYDLYQCHAYMGGRSEGKPELEHREDWTTCCGVDEAARASV